MAAVNQPVEQVADLVQKISLGPQTKTNDVTDASKKAGEVNVSASMPPIDRSVSPLIPDYTDPTMCYVANGYQSGYFYGNGYEGSVNEWEDYSRYLNSDASAVYGDNSSLMYGYGYSPYGPYSPAASPVPTHDGQLYGQQQYQYPSYYQSMTQTSEPYNPKQAPATQGEIPTSAAADKPALSVELPNGGSKGSVNSNINGSVPLKVSQQNSSSILNGSYGRGGVFSGGVTASSYQDPRYSFDGMTSPTPWLDSPSYYDRKHKPTTSSAFLSTASHANNFQTARNQNQPPFSNLMSLQSQRPTAGIGQSPGYQSPGYFNRVYPNNSMYAPYGSNFRAGSGYGYTGYDSRTGGRGWLSGDNKYNRNKGRGNGYGYGNENMDGLNELNRGPRARGLKTVKAVAPATLAGKGQDVSPDADTENKDNSSANLGKEQYNREDFPIKYTDAKFFIIKSYSEDDVHKSIKYSVWASTPNGNKKLAAGYQEAQEKSGGCPVFLLFSVNTSGQFVGLAEMVGPVDFDKTVEYWQQDKWTGCFPVKWHIVKDVPNSLLKHITLENNDNKPVTNSRDTQEVRLEQGLQVLKIFKEYSCKTSILDDFEFYEGREKTVQEKKARQKQAQVWEGKTIDAVVTDEKNNGQLKLPHSLENGSKVVNGFSVENISILKKGSQPNDIGELKPEECESVPVIASQVNGELKQSVETELVGKSDALEGAKQPVIVPPEKEVVKGVTNGY